LILKKHRDRSSVTALLSVCSLGAATALTSPALAQPPPGEAMIARDSRTMVADHVWVILDEDRNFVPNVGIVVGDQATLIIDTGLGRSNGEVILAEARQLSDNTVFYLAATHFHPEHDLGAHAFPADAKMLRWKGQQTEADEDGATTIERFKSFSPAVAKLLEGETFRAPDVVFDDEMTVDLGGVQVRILGVGPNHTRGDTSFFVVEDRVLFTGDTVMPVLPAVSAQSGSLAKWIENLALYQSLQPVSVVPAHGKLIDVSYIERYRSYLSTVQMRVAAAKRDGASVEATIAMHAETISTEFADLAPPDPSGGGIIATIQGMVARLAAMIGIGSAPNAARGRVNAAIQAAYREAP
jgi:glyoxylase-like metal-dependent hydrolase (beta-lactamase superfamily II)